MATFNWPPNPYFVPTAYVSVFGRDDNDGTANKPYRTLQKCKDAGKKDIQIGPGVYREAPYFTVLGINIFGVNYIIDGFLTGNYFGGGGGGGGATHRIHSAVMLNSMFRDQFQVTEFDKCVLKNCSHSTGGSSGINGPNKNTIFSKAIGVISLGSYYQTFQGVKCTFYKCSIRLVGGYFDAMATSLIFHTCDIEITSDVPVRYDLFYNCRFKIGTETIYSYLNGATDAAKLLELKSRYSAKFPTAIYGFEGCKITDPLLNNPELDDFTLQPLSPAKNAGYDGTYIGAKDVGYPTYAFANDLGRSNSFYNASKSVNVIVADDSITLLRDSSGTAIGGGNITEKPKDLLKIQEIKGSGVSFLAADRNREMPTYAPAIDLTAPISAGTALISGRVYINEIDTVTYNNIVYPIRSRIYTIDTNSFTGLGKLYLVKNNAPVNTNLIRFKQSVSGTKILAGTNLTANSWYRVYDDVVSWNGLTVPVGDVIQAITGKLSFTGFGSCVEEFNDGDTWSEFTLNAPILVRRVGNLYTGAIDVGTDGKALSNGHPEYYSALNTVRPEFSVFARYVQVKHYLSVVEAK